MESRIHTPGGSTDFKVWETPFAGFGIQENTRLIDQWLNKALEMRPLQVSCSTPDGLLPEILKDSRGKLIVALLDVTGRDNTEILKKSKLSGVVNLKIRGTTVPGSFCVRAPGKDLSVNAEFRRENGYDFYTFKVDGLPVYSQIEVKYE